MSAHRIQQMADRLREREGDLVLSDGARIAPGGQTLVSYLGDLGVLAHCPNLRLFAVLSDALEWIEDRILCEEHLTRSTPEPPLALADIDLFSGLDPAARTALHAHLRELHVRANDVVFRQGDLGDKLFIIRSGAVRILLPLTEGEPLHIATFARPDFFGEIAFLDRARRTADAIATTDTHLFVVSRTRFDTLAERHPDLGREVYARLARVLALRLRMTDAEVAALRS